MIVPIGQWYSGYEFMNTMYAPHVDEYGPYIATM